MNETTKVIFEDRKEEMDYVVTHYIECEITDEHRDRVNKAYEYLLENAQKGIELKVVSENEMIQFNEEFYVNQKDFEAQRDLYLDLVKKAEAMYTGLQLIKGILNTSKDLESIRQALTTALEGADTNYLQVVGKENMEKMMGIEGQHHGTV